MLASHSASNPHVTPAKAKHTTDDGLSPTSIFANFDNVTPQQKKQSRDVHSTKGKENALARKQYLTQVEEDTNGDWNKKHAALQAKLTGKVTLDWEITTPLKKVITLQPPTTEEYETLKENLAQKLLKRQELLTARRNKLKDNTTSDEQPFLDLEDELRSTECNRWNQINSNVGNNSLHFPVQNPTCEFDPTNPSLRNASYGAANRNGACTIEEMKAGEWGIEHRSLPANDVNAVTFNLRRREPNYQKTNLKEAENPEDEKELMEEWKKLPIDSALSIEINPGAKNALREYLTHSKVTITLSEHELNSKEWGIEHRDITLKDVNNNPFPLTTSWYEEKIGGDGYGTDLKDFTEKAPSVVSNVSSLRASIYSDDTEIYSETDSQNSTWSTIAKEEGKAMFQLTEQETEMYEKGWYASLNVKDGEVDTSIDESRLCQWKYYNNTTIISMDKMLKTQKDVWDNREHGHKMTRKQINSKRRRLATKFNCAPPSQHFFTECLKIALPEERALKLQTLKDSELTVGWYGSLRDVTLHSSLPAAPFDCTLPCDSNNERIKVVWKSNDDQNLIQQDKTTFLQDCTWKSRIRVGPYSKQKIQRRIRKIEQRFKDNAKGSRVDAFWSTVTEENFDLDVVKVSKKENCQQFWNEWRQKEIVLLNELSNKNQALFASRIKHIAFYQTPGKVGELLRKKDAYFMNKKIVSKYVPSNTARAIPLQPLSLKSDFFAHFLKRKNGAVVEIKNDDGSAEFVDAKKRVDSEGRARFQSQEEVSL